jgi:hypothetical protein
MDQPLFNPNENEDQITPEAQDNSLNLKSLSQSKGNSNFITTPSDSPQIQTPQLINDESNSKVKKGKIYLSDLNTFCISYKEGLDKYYPFLFLCSGIISVIIGLLVLIYSNQNLVIIVFLLLGIIFICFSIIIFYTDYHTIYFIMGENSLTILKKSILGKKERVYNSGEIKKAKFHKIKIETGYIYELEIISKNKENKNIFFNDYPDEFFTKEEIDNFLCQINTHIETKM